ncbi:ZIP Zinc transporter [Gimesia chilikensis]|uniref:ZIP Zinc transporter n=1 Tax=Gimesia chilikensis TaxID=2605989 RepID=A0A517WEJ3_9PLAN|nr:hypothetical protein [Gimesia chilikensis]QDU03668.1 ZIP Zinc transporter [Gimesia chilikensis]
MTELSIVHLLWALILGAISSVSLPLGSFIGLKIKIRQGYIAIFAAFGAGALIAALSVELVAPTCFALSEESHGETQGLARDNFYALIVGGILGGLLFITLDSLVNDKGGYLRKRATTLAHYAARRRENVQKKLKGVFEIHPFNVLSEEHRELLASTLSPVSLKHGEQLSPSQEDALIVLEGELEIELENGVVELAGAGSYVGVLLLFIPELASHSLVKARGDTLCLALQRQDVDHLRGISPEFDQACRDLAGEHMERLEQHLILQMQKSVEWTRSAAGAIRTGAEVPGMTIHRTHATHHGTPVAVWLGILLDGIPESLVIGSGLFVTLINHTDVGSLTFFHVIPYTLIAGLFLSNFPEALSSSANMLDVGLNRNRIFWMWFALMVMTAVGAALGFLLAGLISETWLVFAEGVAAGAMLTMITAAMIPEAAAHGYPNRVGLSTLAGFLTAICFKLLE